MRRQHILKGVKFQEIRTSLTGDPSSGFWSVIAWSNNSCFMESIWPLVIRVKTYTHDASFQLLFKTLITSAVPIIRDGSLFMVMTGLDN